MDKEIIHMSLSDLLKKSAMQICYLRKNKEKTTQPSEAALEGNEKALGKSESKYIEMRGTYKFKYGKTNISIHYSFDEIVPNEVACLLIEHKNITDNSGVELWYRNSSILQTAVYQSFASLNSDRKLRTATFFINEGNPLQVFDIDKLYLRSELHLGNQIYSVTAVNEQELFAFYLRKATATLSYDTAKEWDTLYKHKEFDHLHNHIKYRLLQQSDRVNIV